MDAIKTLLMVSLFSIASCGNVVVSKMVESDEALVPYVQRFQQEYGATVNISVTFGEMAANFAGLCYYSPYRHVTINKSIWQRLDESQKEQLVYHELGHCVLNHGHPSYLSSIRFLGWGADSVGSEKDHVFPAYTFGWHFCPGTIMRWFMFNIDEMVNCYMPYRDYYMDELFRR